MNDSERYVSPDMIWVKCPDCGRDMTLADVEWHRENQCLDTDNSRCVFCENNSTTVTPAGDEVCETCTEAILEAMDGGGN